MNDRKQRYLVSGSSALKPDCSRHSNENEHIIDFPARVITTYPVRPTRPSVKHRQSAYEQARTAVRRSDMVNDLRKGSIKGTPFGPASMSSLVAAGALYTFIAVATLFFMA